MVSESQERMLCVVRARAPRRGARGLREVGGPRDRDRRRDRHAAAARARRRRRWWATCRSSALVDDCPLYDLEPAPPAAPLYPPPEATLAAGADPRARCSRCSRARTSPRAARCSSSTTAIVQSRTVRRPEEADAAVLAAARRRAIAVASTATAAASPPTRTAGTIENVLECAANLACAGAEPLGTTNNLNFGNPEKPHIAWQLTEAVRGLGDACRALDAPIVGGNVSLYNEGASGPIYPTPVIGMVGRMPDAERAGRLGLRPGGRRGRARRARSRRRSPASELAKLRGEALPDGLPPVDIEQVIAAQDADPRRRCARGCCPAPTTSPRAASSVAVAECCLAGGIGATLDARAVRRPVDAALR